MGPGSPCIDWIVMKRLVLTPLAAACLAAGNFLAPCAAAQTPGNDAMPPEADSRFEIGRVEVRGQGAGPLQAKRLFSSVDVVAGELVQGDAVRNTWELFRRVPGVLLTEFNQGTTSGKLSLRGFNGEGEVNAVKLLIDGVPSNTNDGNMPFIDLVFPLDIQSITTVRGTNDPRYGLHNIAGNVDITTRTGGNDTDVRLGGGAYGLADLQLAKGIEGGEWTQNYFVGVRHSDGFRDHAQSDKFSLAGKWFYQPSGANWQAGLIVRHHEHTADEPGYLSAADAQATPKLSYAISATDGGKRQLDQISLRAEGTAGKTLSWQTMVYQNEYSDERWVRFSASASQQERDTYETHQGLRASASWRPSVNGLASLVVEGGVDYEHQSDRSDRYNSTARARVSQTRGQAWDLDITGAFVQAVIKPVASLSLVPGLRVDQLGGGFTNRLSNLSFPVNDYGLITQPKLSAIWAVQPGQTVYANLGRSFQVGVGSATFKIPPRTSDLSASVNDGWEAGWKFQGLTGLMGLTGRVALWQQTASDEVMRRLNDPSNDSDNIGSTRRRGLDVQLRAQPVANMEAWLSYSRQQATIVTPDPAAPTTRGKALDHVPHHLYSAGLDWQATSTLRLSGWAQGQTDYELDRNNDKGRFGAYTLLNLGATWQAAKQWELGLTLKNLADRRSEYVWWDTASKSDLHSPGDGRALYASVRVRL
ncbi:MAG: TonB-dependent receptor [Burkholderiales bacterium]|nr:TonB-dependent receptor [Burkholderiales bacterium]